MLTLTPNLEALTRPGGWQRRAYCYEITRAFDGTVFRVTDHDQPVALPTASTNYDFAGTLLTTYAPAVVRSTSAREDRGGLDIPNFEITGAVSVSGITDEDLAAGKFDGAEVVEYLVDWLFPWAGYLRRRTFVITEVTFDGEVWAAQTEGRIERDLRRVVGERYTRDCEKELGSAECGVALGVDAIVGATVQAVDSAAPRRKFTIGVSPGGPNLQTLGWYDLGRVTWTLGDNDGHKGHIRTHDGIVLATSVDLELELETPFEIEIGDKLDLWPGCDKRFGLIGPGDCIDKWANAANYGGWPFLPGNDELLKSP